VNLVCFSLLLSRRKTAAVTSRRNLEGVHNFSVSTDTLCAAAIADLLEM